MSPPTRYRLSLEVRQEIEGISDFTAEDDLEVALSFTQSLRETIKKLATSPFIDRERSDIRPRLRSFPHGNYLIFYQPVDDGIEVVRVMHGSRDIERLLREGWWKESA